MEVGNPYLELYNGYGLSAAEGITKQVARLVATHTALMHNALGYAIQDLLRVVSHRYSEEQTGHLSQTTFEEMVRKQVAEDNGRLSSRLNEVIDSEEQPLSEAREYDVAEVAVDNGQQSIVVQQSRALYQVSQPAKRSIVNLQDDDPPTNPAVDFMEYAFRNKKPGVEQQNKQRSAQLRDQMKCCQCRCLCDPIQHGSNLYCSKCLPNNGPLY